MSNDLKLAIFDLGQVCFRTHLERCYLEWEDMAGIRPGSVSRDFPLDDQYEDYERGTMSGRSYGEYFCMLNELSLDFEEWKEGWNSMFGEIIEPSRKTIKLMQQAGVTVVALSNTNATHVESWKGRYDELIESFDHLYLSNEIGMRKPEPRVFEHVLSSHDVGASQAIYFDDKQENIRTAERLGIESVLFDDDSLAALWWKRRPVPSPSS